MALALGSAGQDGHGHWHGAAAGRGRGEDVRRASNCRSAVVDGGDHFAYGGAHFAVAPMEAAEEGGLIKIALVFGTGGRKGGGAAGALAAAGLVVAA